MSSTVQSSWESPVGRLRIVVSDNIDEPSHCLGLYFDDHRPEPKYWSNDATELPWRRHELMQRVVEQLTAYFADGQFCFDLPYRFSGTDFQLQVWRQLAMIPGGTTRRYQDIANLLGRPTAPRAVGSAIARNPLCIIVPCHRVIASSGGIGGFAGGCDRKEFLLRHEAAAHLDNRTNQSASVTRPVPTMAQPNTVSVRVPGNRPVPAARAAAAATATASNAKQQPPTLA